MGLKNIIKIIFKVLLFAALLFIAFNFRSPIVLRLRSILPIIVIAICIFLLFLEFRKLSKNDRNDKAIRIVLIVLAVIPILIIGIKQNSFYSAKYNVLNADSILLEKYGKHFIVGYHDYSEVKNLVEKKAIGGIFITHYNIAGKTYDEVKKEIQELQDIRKSQNLPPLFISTDQEGGIVSRLSPLISKQPSLAETIKDVTNKKIRDEKVREYAELQSKELRNLGINLNFAPVIDINHGTEVSNDRYSRINDRSISSDPKLVSEVAAIYSQALSKNKVFPTLKHFPGLGRVTKDTHLFKTSLDISKEDLEKSDLIPFKEITKNSDAFVMVGHVGLSSIDKQNSASFSKDIINILRKEWEHDGVIITDDFSMGPVYYSEGGIPAATIKSLNAGVDLILISYDSDLYYEAMNSLLNSKDRLDSSVLDKSETRLTKALNKIK